MLRQISEVGYDEIISIIKPNAKVLDLGCGKGDLLKRLKDEKDVHATGIDICEENIIECVGKGIAVVQDNIDSGLRSYDNNYYDYVILSQTLQVVQKPLLVLKEMVRIGKTAIISFPNFAYWRIRIHLLLKGKMPANKILPYEWYETPNIRLSSIKDVENLCSTNGIKIKKKILLTHEKKSLKSRTPFLYNWFAQECIMVLEADKNE